ncbi:MAG: hypothetical protein Q4F95_09485 [Oscillospiraceae bacterium]|nr:hypothetical protein [Oscillospiraceae bacterium]
MIYFIAYLIYVFGFIFLWAFVHLIRRMYHLIHADRVVKVIAWDRKQESVKRVLFLVAIIIAFVRFLNKYLINLEKGNIDYSDIYFFLCILTGIFFVYFLLVALNSRFIYITDRMIIFEDCVKKAEGYQYRITDDILELYALKPPKTLKKYIIEEDKFLLEDILIENYKMIENQVAVKRF